MDARGVQDYEIHDEIEKKVQHHSVPWCGKPPALQVYGPMSPAATATSCVRRASRVLLFYEGAHVDVVLAATSRHQARRSAAAAASLLVVQFESLAFHDVSAVPRLRMRSSSFPGSCGTEVRRQGTGNPGGDTRRVGRLQHHRASERVSQPTAPRQGHQRREVACISHAPSPPHC